MRTRVGLGSAPSNSSYDGWDQGESLSATYAMRENLRQEYGGALTTAKKSSHHEQHVVAWTNALG